MIVDIKVRRIINIQYDEMKLSTMFSFEDWDLLFCIFKNEDYYTTIDFLELRLISSDEELFDYVNSKPIGKWVNGIEIDKIGKIFSKYKNTINLLAEKPDLYKKEILTVNKVEISFKSDYVNLYTYMKLKQKGIKAYIINIPSEIKNIYGPFGNIMLTEQCLREPDIKKKYVEDIKKITDLSVDQYIDSVIKNKISNMIKEKPIRKDQKEEKTIFLVGPCIVMGYLPAENDLVKNIGLLLKKFHYSYRIVKINSRYFPNELMEYDICQNDMVIFIGTDLMYMDYDFTELLEMYDGTKNLCSNSTMHISDVGCGLIADAIVNDVIAKNNSNDDVTLDKKVVYYAEKEQLSVDTEYEVMMYLKRTGINRAIHRENNGAIVMNANPFTMGHRYLVEYAAEKVDNLFVFVVEEDASYFTFDERMKMVLDGTKDIKNVIVLGSGNFVISNKTFYDYFTKEIDNEKEIDASKDIYIFSRYIAPYFSICKRFVGNEPFDKITAQYNTQMKCILPQYGCELIEIPRMGKDGNIVSGSMVRKALQNDNIDYLRRMLPVSSFNFILNHFENFKNRKSIDRNLGKYNVCMSERFLSVWKLIEYIKKEKYIAIYGVGKYTQLFLNLLSKKDKSKLIFVDKKAEGTNILFMGKKVFPPFELKETFCKYDIVIFSARYYKEMFDDCINLGIDKKRIRYNSYDLYYYPIELYFLSNLMKGRL